MEKIESKKNSIYSTIIFCCAVVILLFVIWLIFISRNLWFDEQIMSFFSSTITESRTNLMKKITFLGNHKFLIPANLILIIFFLFRKKRKEALRLTIIALSSFGLMSLLKNLSQRHRPDNPLVEGITNYSFPSGHALMSIAFFGLLIYYNIAFVKIRWQRNLITGLLFLLIITIGITRIYLNVHYATDVVAGWIFGICWLIFCLYVTDRLIIRKAYSL